MYFNYRYAISQKWSYQILTCFIFNLSAFGKIPAYAISIGKNIAIHTNNPNMVSFCTNILAIIAKNPNIKNSIIKIIVLNKKFFQEIV